MKRIMLNLLAVTDGGQVTRAREFLSRFRKFDSNSNLIILRRKGTLAFCDNVENKTIVDVSIGDSVLRPWLRLAWENFNLKSVVKNYSPNVYLSFSHYLPSAIGKDVVTILGVTNMAPFSPGALSRDRLWLKVKMIILRHGIVSSAKKATHVIALSNLCRNTLIDSGVHGDKISVINNGVNQPQGNCLGSISEAGVPSDFILYVSSFFHYKNFKLLIRAYGALPDEIVRAFPLVLVGRIDDVKYYNQLQFLVERLNLSGRVKFVDVVEKNKLELYYRSASLFVFPSLIENCPNILLEALSFGCPILCSSAQPMEEFGGSAVTYFDPYSELDLSKLIHGCLDNPIILQEMKELSRERSKCFSWDVFTESVVNLTKVNGPL